MGEVAGPAIYVDLKEKADEPEHFLMAVPDQHLFTALYATGKGFNALISPPFRKTSPPNEPEPEMNVKRQVSALKIATDIWTYLIERHLT